MRLRCSWCGLLAPPPPEFMVACAFHGHSDHERLEVRAKPSSPFGLHGFQANNQPLQWLTPHRPAGLRHPARLEGGNGLSTKARSDSAVQTDRPMGYGSLDVGARIASILPFAPLFAL